VTQSETFTGAPLVTKFDEAAPPHVVPAERNALTAAVLGVATPAIAIAKAASEPRMKVRLLKSRFPSCPARPRCPSGNRAGQVIVVAEVRGVRGLSVLPFARRMSDAVTERVPSTSPSTKAIDAEALAPPLMPVSARERAGCSAHW
jgi:hypothetical protein